jgi:ubiquinone/menaquinone biosynthesis C-methylase UbiE
MSDKQLLTYEESVQLLRRDSQHLATVQNSYLDADNVAAAQRFSTSEEFAAMKQFLELDSANRTLKILDLGCGNGIVSYAFASLGHDVYAVDPDTSDDVGLGAITRLIPQLTHGQISTVEAFAESLPFPDHTFDIVYTRQALHHFSDLSKGLSECARVLKSQGLLLTTREHVVNDEEQLKIFLNDHIMHQLHGGENAYPLSKYIAAHEQAGLKVLKCLAPFDTVINHFPISNADLKNQLFRFFKKVLGAFPAQVIVSIPLVMKLYRSRLSRSCSYPGRLFSFLCSKD